MTVKQVFIKLHKKIYLLGTPKKFFYSQKELVKPFFFILMPTSRIRQIWVGISNLLLIYIALYTPI